ncbi:hypothetical protein J6590_079848 [Homalodisca vitripennis]|nr:hypothetical protein J6590_079848 [Homalodisca vitripennis]
MVNGDGALGGLEHVAPRRILEQIEQTLHVVLVKSCTAPDIRAQDVEYNLEINKTEMLLALLIFCGDTFSRTE